MEEKMETIKDTEEERLVEDVRSLLNEEDEQIICHKDQKYKKRGKNEQLGEQ